MMAFDAKFHIEDEPAAEANDRRFDGADRDPPKGWSARPSRIKRLDGFVREYTPLSYAVEPVIRTASLYTLTAPTGTGKTAWLIAVALAIATGRRDILGLDVEEGRVALLTLENPDDVRMRLMVAAHLWHVDPEAIRDNLVVIDQRLRPEEIHEELRADTRSGPFRLVLVDTLSAAFDGDNLNDNVQAGNFMRRLRPLTRLPGLPAVLVAAHPVKNASSDNLVPYGGGAILNEVDGNLTLNRRSDGPGGFVELHWSGKLRGLDFTPIQFRFDVMTAPAVVDAKGREVKLPVMLPVTINEMDVEAQKHAEDEATVALLRAIVTKAGQSQRELAAVIGRTQSVVSTKMRRLLAEKYVEDRLGRIEATMKGKKLIDER